MPWSSLVNRNFHFDAKGWPRRTFASFESRMTVSGETLNNPTFSWDRLGPKLVAPGTFRANCRQTFPYPVTEELPVIQAQSLEAPLIAYQGDRFCMRSTIPAMNGGFNLEPEWLLG